MQLEQRIHSDLLSIKSVVASTFKQLVGAPYPVKKPTPRALVLDAPGASKTGPLVRSAIAHPADSSNTDATDFIDNLSRLLSALVSPLSNIAASGNDRSALAGSKSLHTYNTLLDVCLIFYQSFQSSLDKDTANAFVSCYNNAVTQYNAAVTKTNAILSTCTIHTH
jgi:hypothetical protein